MPAYVTTNVVTLVICALLGIWAIFRYALDQFDKPVSATDTGDPWKFVVPRYLTPRRQYLLGFLIYFAALIALFALVSFFVGPKVALQIGKVLGGGAATEVVDAPAWTAWDVLSYPTFPLAVALYIVAVNPSLPKQLDFEAPLRALAHRIAYIPKNMDSIFNYMRFSDFDLSRAKLDAAWEVVDVRQVALDSPDLKTVAPILDRAVLLYARAGTLAGDLALEGTGTLQQGLSLEVFKLYRSQIQNVGVSLQAVSARFGELANLTPADRKKAIQGAQREVIKSLEFLYVIFACAITGIGMDRLNERLRTLGFTSEVHPEAGIPWNAVLKAIIAAGGVLLVACLIAAFALNTIVPPELTSNIPTTAKSIIQTLIVILLVHLVALGTALHTRTKLIAREKYYSETGRGEIVAYFKIALICYLYVLPCYLAVKGVLELYPALTAPPEPPAVGAAALDAADAVHSWWEITQDFLWQYLYWTIVPALCGLMTAFTVDRPADTKRDRIVSGAWEGGVLAIAAEAMLHLTLQEDQSAPPLPYQLFTLVLYGGLGFVLGFILPAAVKTHWAAREHRLEDKIALLRTSVLQYFHDMQQFTQWLYAKSDDLGGKRPLDVLAEDTGPQRLIALLAQTRARTPAPQP